MARSYKTNVRSALQNPSRRRWVLISALALALLIIFPITILGAMGFFRRDESSASATGADDQGNVQGTADPPPANQTTTSNPTSSPTASPTGGPTVPPTNKPVTYRPGLLTVEENGLILSEGLTSRLIALAGDPVKYHNGQNSTIPFHGRPDFGATYSVPDDATENQGGWVYVSNSEMPDQGEGGVGALTFDKDGNVIKYEMLLTNTTQNCAGGRTPWGTWVSCEEIPYVGQINQVDPFNRRPPEILSMSKVQGGRYEAFTFDDRDPAQPRYFATEDQPNGPTRRWTPSPDSIDWENDPWGMLHGNGTLDYLVLYPSDEVSNTGTYEWVASVHEARKNSHVTYPSTEGIDRKDNMLYIICKDIYMLYIVNLDSNTYMRVSTVSGLFDGHPDQVMRLLNSTDEILYFNEDQGVEPGIHGRDAQGNYFTILEGPGWSPETTGLSFSPNGHHFYVAFQDAGALFEIKRLDGYPFDGETLDVRYHGNDMYDPYVTL